MMFNYLSSASFASYDGEAGAGLSAGDLFSGDNGNAGGN